MKCFYHKNRDLEETFGGDRYVYGIDHVDGFTYVIVYTYLQIQVV